MINYNNKKFKKYIPNKEIHKKIVEIVESLNIYYKSKDLVIICVLNGSVVVLSELLRHFKCEYKLDYIELSSYKGGMETSGSIEIIQEIKAKLKNKYVLIIEDIVDSGTTLNYLYKKINKMGAKDIKIFTLLFKKCKYKYDIDINWYAFIVEDLFVIGYGMDYNFKFRGLKDIYCLAED